MWELEIGRRAVAKIGRTGESETSDSSRIDHEISMTSFPPLSCRSRIKTANRATNVSTNARGNHRARPRVLTFDKPYSKKRNIENVCTARQIATDSQKDHRDHLALQIIITTENGTTVPNAAVCHLCGRPQRSEKIARAKATSAPSSSMAFSVENTRCLECFIKSRFERAV
jgi:hypothetical protein